HPQPFAQAAAAGVVPGDAGLMHARAGRLRGDQDARSGARLQHGAWPQRQACLAEAAGADVAQQRVERAAHGGSTFPGLRMPSGSNAAFTARIAASVGASNACAMKSRLATPMPCSPDSVPPSESV